MTTASPSLRDRQAAQVRAAVLEAAITELEKTAVEDIAMGDVAAAAGVSLRTLYRYFPDRASLLHAAGEHLYESLGVPRDIAGPGDVSASFLDAARRLSRRPALTRALVQTTAGRAARSAARSRRVEAISAALEPLTDELDAQTSRRATAVITHLCGAASWMSICDESGLDAPDAQQAVAWAIDTLIAGLEADRPAPIRRSKQSPARLNHRENSRDDH